MVAIRFGKRSRIDRSRRGFTLIELLAVLAIIATLASLLLPVFSVVLAKTHQARDLSNLHQVGLACSLYLDDWGGAYPFFIQRESTDAPRYYPWQERLADYARDPRIFDCPAGIDADKSHWVPIVQRHQAVFFGNSYRPNRAIFLDEVGVEDFGLSVHDFSLQRPSQTILFGESAWGYSAINYKELDRGGPSRDMFVGQWVPLGNGDYQHVLTNAGGSVPYLQPHAGRVAFLLADGHVAALKPAQTFGSSEMQNMWGMDDTPVTWLKPPSGSYTTYVSWLTSHMNSQLR